MDDLEDLLTDHNESNFLDFKVEDYPKAKKHELLKDILSFANSDYSGDRFIIIGVNEKTDPRTYYDVEILQDSAALQQFIESNISPELEVDIYKYNFEGKNLGIIKVINPVNQPYEIKKDYVFKVDDETKVWKEGTMFIRVGSKTKLMSRKYLDKIYEKNFIKEDPFINLISITFTANNKSTIDFKSIAELTLPSEEARLELAHIFQKKMALQGLEFEKYIEEMINQIGINEIANEFSIKQLEKKIQNVHLEYRDQDNYFLSEQTSHKFNLSIFNNSQTVLKNTKFIIKFPFENGATLVTKIVKDPSLSRLEISIPNFSYPTIENEFMHLGVIKIDKGDIRHKLSTEIFDEDLRIYFDPQLIGKKIDINIEIHAENLPVPQKFSLKINVV